MNTVQKHVIRYPKARATTLSHLIMRDERTQQLKKELAAEKRERNKLTVLRRTLFWLGRIWGK